MGSSGVYLNDHLAGATAGIRLAKRCRDRSAPTAVQAMLDAVVAELEEDRITLEHVMEAAGVQPDRRKQVAATAVEVASRLAHVLPVIGTRSRIVADLEDIEVLSLGIEGKRLLWAALREAARHDERFQRFDFGSLEDRAGAQRARVERVRLELALRALGRSPVER